MGHDESLLDSSQDKRKRKRNGEGDERKQPVVGEHGDPDDDHQRAAAHPRHATPLEELRQRLDVGRDPGDQPATTLFVVVSEAEMVDVVDQL